MVFAVVKKLVVPVFFLGACLLPLATSAFIQKHGVQTFTNSWGGMKEKPIVRLVNQQASVQQQFQPHVSNTKSSPLSSSSSLQAITLPDLLLATIDSDIANIPENEFATVFTGGIIVMLGGVLSALIVGFIIDKRDLYANIVADSYAQGAQDEEFWKGLSEEERKKTQELLQRLKSSKEGGGGGEAETKATVSATSTTAASSSSTAPAAATAAQKSPSAEAKETKEIGMFSDYGDDA